MCFDTEYWMFFTSLILTAPVVAILFEHFMTCLWAVLFLCLLFNYSWPFSFILADSQAVV